MNENVKKMLNDEIERQFEDLSTLASGSDEKVKAIEELVKLYKLKIDETKTELDYNEKLERRKMEIEQFNKEKDQQNEQCKERYFKLGIEVAGIILPLIFYANWMKKGFKFEETGVFASTTFKGLFQKFKPTRK